jgi:putative DNA-invertase from lambdoid prophage Rac
MATILYARVSTAEQTIEHQIAHARTAGFSIDEVVADNGVSGLSTRLTERPEGRRLYDKLRAGDILVVRWVDRLGRNYEDVCDTIRHFMRRGVVIRTVINNFTFDGATKDPMQQAVRDALIAFMAATAQAHRPRPPRPPSGPVSSTRRLMETEPTLDESRAIRALSSIMREPCWGRKPWGSLGSPTFVGTSPNGFISSAARPTNSSSDL